MFPHRLYIHASRVAISKKMSRQSTLSKFRFPEDVVRRRLLDANDHVGGVGGLNSVAITRLKSISGVGYQVGFSSNTSRSARSEPTLGLQVGLLAGSPSRCECHIHPSSLMAWKVMVWRAGNIRWSEGINLACIAKSKAH